MTTMPRVAIHLLIETDQDAADVQLAVLASLNDRYRIVNCSVATIGGDDDPTPEVAFVVCPLRGLLKTFVDLPDEADEFAKREGAVVVEWSAAADHRGEVTA